MDYSQYVPQGVFGSLLGSGVGGALGGLFGGPGQKIGSTIGGIGGAILPLPMGYISDKTGSMQTAYIVPLACFLVVLYYGMKGYKVKNV